MRVNRRSIEITASADNPVVSVEDMAAYLRVSTSDQNALIASYIEDATSAVKNYLRRALKTETFKLTMDGFTQPGGDERLLALGPGLHVGSREFYLGSPGAIQLSFPPVASITSITTYDTSNASSVLSSAAYSLDAQGGRIYLNSGYTWPTALRDYNAVEIIYVAGYGSGSVPGQIVGAIKEYVSRAFEGCDPWSDGIKQRLAPYRIADGLAR